MEMYETNCCLGYGEYAILIKCKEGFLCIDTNENPNRSFRSYYVGELVTDVDEDDKKQMVKIDNDKQKYYINGSPLRYDFLFNYFLARQNEKEYSKEEKQ